MIDDCHATGFLGDYWSGHPRVSAASWARSISLRARSARHWAAHPVALQSGRKEIVAWLRQRSRPYLFSNSVAPIIAASSIAVLDLLDRDIRLPSVCMRTPGISVRKWSLEDSI